MAFSPYHNITGSTGINVELIAPGENSGNIHSIMITNIHDSADATFTLFIQDQPTGSAFSTFNIIRKIVIPAAVSLLIDEPKLLAFDNSENGYGLYLTIGAIDGTNLLDIIISLQ